MLLQKSASANLENKRMIFLEIGMIISLILVLLAFNWKTYINVDNQTLGIVAFPRTRHGVASASQK